MNTRTNILWAAGLIVALLGAPAFAGSPYGKLDGTWIVEGHPDPASGIPDFVNLATITAGAPGPRWIAKGQIVNVDPSEGTSVGGWEWLTGRTYAITFTGFLPVGPDTVRFVVSATVELHAYDQHFSGPFRTEVFSLAGDPLFAFEGTVSATRQPIQPY